MEGLTFKQDIANEVLVYSGVTKVGTFQYSKVNRQWEFTFTKKLNETLLRIVYNKIKELNKFV